MGIGVSLALDVASFVSSFKNCVASLILSMGAHLCVVVASLTIAAVVVPVIVKQVNVCWEQWQEYSLEHRNKVLLPCVAPDLKAAAKKIGNDKYVGECVFVMSNIDHTTEWLTREAQEHPDSVHKANDIYEEIKKGRQNKKPQGE